MMYKRKLIVTLALGLTVGMFTGCGDSGTSTTTPGSGSVYMFLGDAPFGDILSARMNITSIDLMPVGADTGGAALPSSLYIRANVAGLRDSLTILNVGSLEVSTCDRADMNITIPSLWVLDLTQDPPVKSITATVSMASTQVNIHPPLVIAKDKLTALRIELDMLRSVRVDAQGQVTGAVNPVFNITPLNASADGHFTELDNLVGFVRSVTVNAPGQTYTGNFLIQLLSGTGAALYVNTTTNTQFYGVPSLSSLWTGSVVEMEGYVDTDGNLVATAVEVEGRADVSVNLIAFMGIVTNVTRDESGGVTGFTLFTTDIEPDPSGLGVLWDTPVTVDASAVSTYQYTSRSTNFANPPLAFDATTIFPGQELSVFGTYVTTTDATTGNQTTALTAQNIYLRLQGVQGNYLSIVRAGSDDKTGAFRLNPAATLLRRAPVMVFTDSSTKFVDVAGLSALSPQYILMARGLAFYERQATTINGVPVPAGTIVVLARQVHRLQ